MITVERDDNGKPQIGKDHNMSEFFMPKGTGTTTYSGNSPLSFPKTAKKIIKMIKEFQQSAMNKDKDLITPDGNPIKENEVVIWKVHSTYDNAFYDSIVFKTGGIVSPEGLHKRDTANAFTFKPTGITYP